MKPVHVPLPDPSALSFYNAHPGQNRWLEVRTGNNITGLAHEKGVFARCSIPPHTRLAPYLGRVCSPMSTGPYCLQVRDADNELVCIDAAEYLLDVGYLQPLSARQRTLTATPPNYGRYVNSIRPDQMQGDGFNAIFLPDPVEGFSWLVSGQRQIAQDTEILIDYGNQFWGYHSPPVPTSTHLPLEEGNEDQAPPGTALGIGKEFSSDNTGDGPWYHRSHHWTQYLGSDIHYTNTTDHLVLRYHNIGLRIARTDLISVYAGTLLLSDLPMELVVHHVLGQEVPWIQILHCMYL